MTDVVSNISLKISDINNFIFLALTLRAIYIYKSLFERI